MIRVRVGDIQILDVDLNRCVEPTRRKQLSCGAHTLLAVRLLATAALIVQDAQRFFGAVRVGVCLCAGVKREVCGRTHTHAGRTDEREAPLIPASC